MSFETLSTVPIRKQWTPERDAILLELKAKNISARRIALEIGHGVTKNAVLGRIHALGLSDHNRSIWNENTEALLRQRIVQGASTYDMALELGISLDSVYRKARRMGLRVLRVPGLDGAIAANLKHRQLARSPRKPRQGAIVAGIVPTARCKQFMGLLPGECRYPHGDPGTPGFFFCAADALPERPYCQTHYNLCCRG